MNVAVCVCSYGGTHLCLWERSAIGGGQSPLHPRLGAGRYDLPQGDAVKARLAALIFLLPLCTSAGFSHYAALNIFLCCIFCFIHELAA